MCQSEYVLSVNQMMIKSLDNIFLQLYSDSVFFAGSLQLTFEHGNSKQKIFHKVVARHVKVVLEIITLVQIYRRVNW